MSTHYYTSNPSVEHDLREIEFSFAGKQLRFMTDANVFSKDRVDFGSSLLIRAMQIGEQDHVLDIGCGYGPIGICAAIIAKQGKAVLIDVNQRAVDLANQNIRRNGIEHAEARVQDGTELINQSERYQVVLTNPPIRAGKETVFGIYETAQACLVPNGVLWVVIQKKQGADSTEKKLKELFADVELVDKEKGYRIYKAIKLNT